MKSRTPCSTTLFTITLPLLITLTTSSIYSANAKPPFTIEKNTSDTIPLVDSNQLQVFDKVEIEASFPGGIEGWRSFLVEQLNANTPVDHGAPAGSYTVWVQFIVDKEGKPSEFKALTHHGYGMEAEVLRVLRMAPQWTPAMQDGRIVKAYRKQPITFVVEEEKKRRRRRD